MSVNHIINEIYNSNIRKVILLDDNTTLLDYGHRFMGSLHAVDSKSWIQVLFRCNFMRYWSAVNSL